MAKPRVGAVGPAFRAALERGRKRYNAALAEAAAAGNFDSEGFLASFAAAAGPAAEGAGEAAPQVVDSLFELALAQGRRSGGAFSPPQGWAALLAALGPRFSEEPARLAPALYNALFNLGRFPGARPADWARRLGAVSSHCRGAADVLAAGKALSWLCGLAHYRAGALAALDALPRDAAAGVVGVAVGRLSSALASLRDDPWASLDGEGGRVLTVAHRVGGFRGFGGPFLAPPVLAYASGAVFARQGAGVWRLHADRFGAALVREEAGPWKSDPPAPDFTLEDDGRVGHGGRWARLAELAGPSSWTSDGRSLAVTLPRSHFVYVAAAL